MVREVSRLQGYKVNAYKSILYQGGVVTLQLHKPLICCPTHKFEGKISHCSGTVRRVLE